MFRFPLLPTRMTTIPQVSSHAVKYGGSATLFRSPGQRRFLGNQARGPVFDPTKFSSWKVRAQHIHTGRLGKLDVGVNLVAPRRAVIFFDLAVPPPPDLSLRQHRGVFRTKRFSCAKISGGDGLCCA